MPRRSSNPLSEHKQRLQEAQDQIAREVAAAEKTLRQTAKPARPKLEPERKLRINTFTARELPPRPQDHLFPGGRARTTRGQKRRPKTEARLEQIKFLFLCLLFAALVLFLWKNLH